MEFLVKVDNKTFHPNSGIKSKTKLYLQEDRVRHMLMFKMLEYFKLLFENEIYNQHQPSVFKTFHVSLLKAAVAASVYLGSTSIPSLSYSQVVAIDPSHLASISSINNFFALVVPTTNSLELIMCWLDGAKGSTNHPLPSISKLNTMSHQKHFKMISDFLIGGRDNWAISDDFFEKLKVNGIDIQAVDLKYENMTKVFNGVNADLIAVP